MSGLKESGAKRAVLVVSLVNHWPVAARMATRFALAGCRVAAIYPSKSHPLACVRSVTEHHAFSTIHPHDSLLRAIVSSAAEVIVPCDDLAVRLLHVLHAAAPATPEGARTAEVIKRSLGDPTAYLVVGSRHEIQTAARSAGLAAAESFAIGKTSKLEALAQTLPFPWVLKADHNSGGAGMRIVQSLAQARRFIELASASPNLGKVLKQLIVNGNRAPLTEWLHDLKYPLSAQRLAPGQAARTVTACWQGEVLAAISVTALAGDALGGVAAHVRILENEQMEQAARRMAQGLGLSGFHGFDFMLEPESGRATLVEMNGYCMQPCHLNAGPGRDLVGAFVERWSGEPPVVNAPQHPGREIAFFPQVWANDPSDPILATGAHDIPLEDQPLVNRTKRLAMREKRYQAMKSKMPAARDDR